jgi:hypothetical protein
LPGVPNSSISVLWVCRRPCGVNPGATGSQHASALPAALRLLAVAAVLVCAVPAGTFWTFAVDHGPSGAGCPECAVVAYLGYGPIDGWGRDDLRFDRLLCDSRRRALRAQAERLADAVKAATTSAGLGLLHAETGPDSQVTTTGTRATVSTSVALMFTVTDPARGGGPTYFRVNTPRWTFDLVSDDGWRVCRVDAPDLCATALRCTPAPIPSSTPSPSASSDLLDGLRKQLPCGSRDPFRDMRGPGECASASPDSTAPSARPS